MLFHFPFQTTKKNLFLLSHQKKQCWTNKGNKIAHDEYHRFCDKALESNYWKWLLLLFGASRLFGCHDTAILLATWYAIDLRQSGLLLIVERTFYFRPFINFFGQRSFVSALGSFSHLHVFCCATKFSVFIHCRRDYSWKVFLLKFLNFPLTFHSLSKESGWKLIKIFRL